MSSLIQVLVIISFRSGKYDRYLRYETSAVDSTTYIRKLGQKLARNRYLKKRIYETM